MGAISRNVTARLFEAFPRGPWSCAPDHGQSPTPSGGDGITYLPDVRLIEMLRNPRP